VTEKQHSIDDETRAKMREDVAKQLNEKIIIERQPFNSAADRKLLDGCVDAVLDLLNEPIKPTVDIAAEKLVYAFVARIAQEPKLDRAWQALSNQRRAELVSVMIEQAIGLLQP